MTFQDFNTLSFEEKKAVVWSKGVFLMNHISLNERVNCYAIEKFFVELIYAPEETIVIDAKAFVDGHRLDKYASTNYDAFKLS